MTVKPTTKDAIVEAAFLTFNENPGASLGDVAKRAGVGRATLHRYFSARQDLIAALAEIAMDELDAAIDAATADAETYTQGLQLSLAAAIPLASRQWFLAHEDFDAMPDLVKRYKADIEELHAAIDAARAEDGFSADMPTKWIAEVYENLIYAAWTMVREEEATTRQAADLAWRSFLNGVSK